MLLRLTALLHQDPLLHIYYNLLQCILMTDFFFGHFLQSSHPHTTLPFNMIYEPLRYVNLSITKNKGTMKIYQLNDAINVSGDEITVLLAAGQHHGVATHQCKGHLAEQLAGGLAFFQSLAPCQCCCSLLHLNRRGFPRRRVRRRDPPGDKLLQYP